jgi:hypothetical protein
MFCGDMALGPDQHNRRETISGISSLTLPATQLAWNVIVECSLQKERAAANELGCYIIITSFKSSNIWFLYRCTCLEISHSNNVYTTPQINLDPSLGIDTT